MRHIRYSVKTTALFSNLAEPTQHAVDDKTLKTLCGRDAKEYWKLDDLGDEHITCKKCRLAIAKLQDEIL